MNCFYNLKHILIHFYNAAKDENKKVIYNFKFFLYKPCSTLSK